MLLTPVYCLVGSSLRADARDEPTVSAQTQIVGQPPKIYKKYGD
jgi:hypothetical protein